jgi:hypothetical protein
MVSDLQNYWTLSPCGTSLLNTPLKHYCLIYLRNINTLLNRVTNLHYPKSPDFVSYSIWKSCLSIVVDNYPLSSSCSPSGHPYLSAKNLPLYNIRTQLDYDSPDLEQEAIIKILNDSKSGFFWRKRKKGISLILIHWKKGATLLLAFQYRYIKGKDSY